MNERDICVVGVGGGGGRIVERVAGLVAAGPVLAAVNTDARALDGLTAAARLQIGGKLTRGLGAGGDVEVGRQAAEEDLALIRGCVEAARLAFVVAGLGGGTGTGAAPVVLKAAREAGALTLCFATLPFAFEGGERRRRAADALAGLRAACDALIVVDNDRLFDAAGDVPLAEAFLKADETLATGIRSIWKLVTCPGYINLDFADLQRMTAGSGGLCTLGFGAGTGKGRVPQAVAALANSALTDHGRLLAAAQSVLVSLVGGPDLALKEVGDLMKALGAATGPACQIKMGTVIDEAARGRLQVTLLIAQQWTAAPAAPAAAAVAAAAAPAVPAAPGVAAAAPREARGKRRQTQTSLSLDGAARGRFKDVEPTLLDGEDLDIPTFIRRAITIER